MASMPTIAFTVANWGWRPVWRFRMVTIDFRGKIGLGQMQQEVDINGATHVLRPDGSTTVFEGGLLALRSNIGHHQRDELTFIPELGVNVGLQLTRYLNVRRLHVSVGERRGPRW